MYDIRDWLLSNFVRHGMDGMLRINCHLYYVNKQLTVHGTFPGQGSNDSDRYMLILLFPIR